jgi:hypothetical protein
LGLANPPNHLSSLFEKTSFTFRAREKATFGHATIRAHFKMGAGQSSPSDAELQEQIARKIRALELRAESIERQAEEEADYVHVNGEKNSEPDLGLCGLVC